MYEYLNNLLLERVGGKVTEPLEAEAIVSLSPQGRSLYCYRASRCYQMARRARSTRSSPWGQTASAQCEGPERPWGARGGDRPLLVCL